jgi:hypothetical protein
MFEMAFATNGPWSYPWRSEDKWADHHRNYVSRYVGWLIVSGAFTFRANAVSLVGAPAPKSPDSAAGALRSVT